PVCPLARKHPYQKHPGVKEEKSKGCGGSKWVTWRSPLPEVSMENIWQLRGGVVPGGAGEARKNGRIRPGSTHPRNVSGKRKFVSWRRVLPSRKKTSLIGTRRDVPGGHGGPSAVPGTLSRTRLVRSPVTPNVGTTWLPGRTTGMGTGLSPPPSIRTVKAAKLCSGFEPSGSTYVWKRTVSLSTNVGQQVRKGKTRPTMTGGGVPVGRRVTCVRSPVARSSTTIWTASSPPGPGPRSVKAIRRPFGLKTIGGDRLPPRLKLGSRLAGPRRRSPRPSERTRKNPFWSGDSVGGPNNKNSSFTSNTIVAASGLTPRRCSGKKNIEVLPYPCPPNSELKPMHRSCVDSDGPNSTTVIGSRSPRRMRNACRQTFVPAASTRHSLSA